jgi:hypothetical protein
MTKFSKKGECKMKKIIIFFLTIVLFSLCSQSEAIDLKHFNGTTYFDRDSGYVDKEYMMVDLYDINIQNNENYLNWYQKRAQFNNNIRKQIYSAKYTAVFRETPQRNRYGKIDSGCLTFGFEFYDRNNQLIFSNNNIFEEYRGSPVAMRLQGIFNREYMILR